MLSLFLSAFLLGLIFNAAPGAVLAETIRQGLQGGFRPALAVQIGSLAGDATWAIIGLAGIGFLFQIDALRLPIGLAGALYLLWLAWDAWRSAHAGPGPLAGSPPHSQHSPLADSPPHSHPGRLAEATCASATQSKVGSHRKASDRSPRSPLRTGAVISLTNPHNVVYWAALGSAMGAVGVADPRLVHYLVFFTAFMTSSVLWCFFCAAIVEQVFGRANARWSKISYRLCAVALLLLALASLKGLMAPLQAATGS